MGESRILIQDTDTDIREILRFVLEENHFHVMALVDCENIDRHITAFKPHIVMLDYKISGTECIRAHQVIKASYPGLPVIAMSCNGNIQDTYKESGFANYILKPFDLDELCRTLNKHLAIPKH